MVQCGESLSRQVSVTGTSTGSGVNWWASNDSGTGTDIGQLESYGHLRLVSFCTSAGSDVNYWTSTDYGTGTDIK